MQSFSNPPNAVSAALVLSMMTIILLLGVAGSVAETHPAPRLRLSA